jgi:lipoprotein signal peptidase
VQLQRWLDRVFDRRGLLIVVASLLTAVDLGQKASAPAYGHPRDVGYVLIAAAITVVLVLFVPRVPSRALAVAGGVAAAGAFGNLVSALAWRGGIPNPIVVGQVAFNVADLCAVTGAIALVLGAVLFAVRNPALLRQPI